MKLPVTHIDFGIKATKLHVGEITTLLGIDPTRAFNPYEPYVGKAKVRGEIVSIERNRPSFGTWHFSTETSVESQYLEDHALFLLKSLNNATPKIGDLLKSTQYDIWLTIWYVGPSGFEISSQVLARLSNICKRIRVVCFDVEEQSEGL